MASALQLNETVFVPISVLDKEVQSPSAFFRTKVLEIIDKSVIIDVGGGDVEKVASSKCQRNIGIGIVAVGDLESESTLIDPLSESVRQFCRLLSSDDFVFFHKVRSVKELAKIWSIYHTNFSHLIFIGHGNGTAMKFAVDGWIGAEALSQALDIDGQDEKSFINLSCELGKAAYGKKFSNLSACGSFIAPFQSVHGAIASHFVQSFLIYHLIHGETTKVAFRHARLWVAGAASFRMWRGGSMITDA